ncbi:hypothetical protein I3843_13G024600 [Carya illinoinensis]|nr:hypothetical protein I3843_13G024600 [Carya illinoinensis]
MKRINIAISMLAVLAMTDQFMVRPGEAITCGQVEEYSLVPCAAYLITGGVETIKASCPNTDEKWEACKCVKQAALPLPNLKDDLAAGLPNIFFFFF